MVRLGLSWLRRDSLCGRCSGEGEDMVPELLLYSEGEGWRGPQENGD